MGYFEKIEFKKAWGVFFTIFTIFATFLGVYAYFENTKPKIEYHIIANSNVYDLNEDLSKLDIVYDSVSLKSLKENLRIISIRIINTGKIDILKGFYDVNDPLGVFIKNGRIIETPTITYASNSYLKSNIRTKTLSKNKVIFSEIILEESEYFNIKILLLHPKDTTPQIIPVGKIAGIKEINVIDNQKSDSESNVFIYAFGGSILVQFLRFSGFLIITVILLSASVFIYIKFDYLYGKYSDKMMINKFKSTVAYYPSRDYNVIFEIFINHGLFAIHRINYYLNNEKGLNGLINKNLKAIQKVGQIKPGSLYKNKNSNSNLVIISLMIEKKFVTIKEGNVDIDDKVKESIGLFVEYLDKNDKYKIYHETIKLPKDL